MAANLRITTRRTDAPQERVVPQLSMTPQTRTTSTVTIELVEHLLRNAISSLQQAKVPGMPQVADVNQGEGGGAWRCPDLCEVRIPLEAFGRGDGAACPGASHAVVKVWLAVSLEGEPLTVHVSYHPLAGTGASSTPAAEARALRFLRRRTPTTIISIANLREAAIHVEKAVQRYLSHHFTSAQAATCLQGIAGDRHDHHGNHYHHDRHDHRDFADTAEADRGSSATADVADRVSF